MVGSFTSGAKMTRKSTLASAPKPAAILLASRFMLASINCMVSRFSVRAVPASVAVCGITL
jgi:hypothetical protein